MQSCRRCDIVIRGSKYCCPLCGGALAGEADPVSAGYPAIHSKVTKLSIVRIAIFCFIALEIAMVAIQYMAGHLIQWGVFAMICAPVGCVDLILAFYYRHSILKLVANHTYLGMAIAVVIDYLTGLKGWSVEWLLPCAFPGVAIAIICIGFGMKMDPEEFIIYVAAAVGLSFSQLVFIRLGWNGFRLPAVISMAFMAIMIVWALLFFFRAFKRSAARVFHV